jgi:hypothetical protein
MFKLNKNSIPLKTKGKACLETAGLLKKYISNDNVINELSNSLTIVGEHLNTFSNIEDIEKLTGTDDPNFSLNYLITFVDDYLKEIYFDKRTAKLIFAPFYRAKILIMEK